jgi:hypothetical protein
MDPRQEVEVRTGVLERIDHVVRHIRASTCLWIDPPAPQVQNSMLNNLGEHVGECSPT